MAEEVIDIHIGRTKVRGKTKNNHIGCSEINRWNLKGDNEGKNL